MAKKTKTEPKLDRTDVVAELDIKLTDDELADRSHRCAIHLDELERSQTEFKAIKKEWNDKHKELKSDIRELSLAHVTGREWRETECEQVFDLENKLTWYELDGERYNELEMTEYQIAKVKQGSLLGDGANAMDAAGVKHSDPDDNHKTDDDPVFGDAASATALSAVPEVM